MSQPKPNAWELAADDILSVMFRDAAAYQSAAFTMGLLLNHLPTRQHKAFYYALASIYNDGLQPHDTLLIDRAKGQLDVNWANLRIALYDPTRTGATFDENVRLVIRKGTAAQHAELYLDNYKRLTEADADYNFVASETIARLTSTPHVGINGVTAEEHGQDFYTYMQGEPDHIRTSGNEWLDSLTGGLVPGVWMIGGAYKSRKTTFALNLMLGALLANRDLSVGFLSKEMLTRQVVAQMVAMLANAYMKRNGWLKTSDGLISSTNLQNARRRYKNWQPNYVKAVDYGIDTYRELRKRFRIYDSTPEHGGITDVASVERLINHDISLYKGSLFMLDYLQLLSGVPNIYERTADAAQRIQQITKRNDITMFVLAQLNEETIKTGSNGYSPGVKGGGDPAATADFFLTTHYKQGEYEDDDTLLPVQMKLSRHSRGGSNVKQAFHIHPASGLILDSLWI